MLEYVKLYFISLPIFLAFDAVWLTLVAKNFYKEHLGYLMREVPNIWPAVIFYLLFTLGMVVFVVKPSLSSGSFVTALALGALFGLISYATYDLTNMATIKDWPLLVTVVDLIWGTTLSAVVAMLSFFVASKL